MAYKIGEKTISRGADFTLRCGRFKGELDFELPDNPDWGYVMHGIDGKCQASIHTDTLQIANFSAGLQIVMPSPDILSSYVELSLQLQLMSDPEDAFIQNVNVRQLVEFNEDTTVFYMMHPQDEFELTTYVSVKLVGTFEIWADLRGHYAGESEYIYSAYNKDYVPMGVGPQIYEYYYVPKTDALGRFMCQVTISGGGVSKSFDVDLTGSENDFRHGVCPVRVGVGADSGTAAGGYSNNVLAAEATVVGGSYGTTFGGINHPEEDIWPFGIINRPTYITVADNKISYYDIGLWIKKDVQGNSVNCGTAKAAYLDIVADGDTVIYNGVVTHLDGTPAEVTVQTVEDDQSKIVSGSAGVDGQIRLERHYAGKAEAAFGDLGHPFNKKSHNDPPGWYGLEIPDCRVNDEPDFPGAAMISNHPNYHWFDDSRVEIGVPLTFQPAAVTFGAKDSYDIHTFGAGWIPVNCSVTVNAGNIIVKPTANDASIARDFGELRLNGWRLIDCQFSSDDSEEIKLTIAGREYLIKNGDSVLDVLGYTNNQSSTAYTQLYNVDPPFAAGIGQVGEIRISGLRNGKTYTFSKLVAKRPAMGRYIRAIIDPVFIGTRPGDSRSTDNVGMFHIGGDEYRSKLGTIIIDGVLAAELIDMYHIDRGAYGWGHITIDVTSADAIYPACSSSTCLSMTINKSRHTYTNELLPITYLKHGVYNADSTISINYQETCTFFHAPPDAPYKEFTFRKLLKGQCLARIMDNAGNPVGDREVTVKTRKRVDGTVKSTDVKKTNALGELWLPSNPQPLVTRAVKLSDDGAGTWTVSGLNDNYVGHEVFFAYDFETDRPPGWGEITSQSGDKITVSTSKKPNNGDYFYIILDYNYELSVYGGNPVIYKLRNHNMTFATIAGVVTVSGLLYHPDSGWLTFVPESGCLEYL